MSTANPASELSRWDDDYQVDPEAVKQTGAVQYPGLDMLADGSYYFAIVEGILAATPKTGETIFRLIVRVTSPGIYQGQILERVNFFRTKPNIDRLGADFCVLGFDADQWTPKAGRPFSKEILKVIPKLPGICFMGKKTTTQGDEGKMYHNLFLNRRVASTAPVTPAPAPSPGNGQQPAPVAAGRGSAGTDSQIPF